MIVDAIQFTKMIPIFGTSKFESRYEAAAGWVIEVRGPDVVLERKANPAQNIVAVPAYRVVGESFCIPETHTSTPFPAGILSAEGQERLQQAAEMQNGAAMAHVGEQRKGKRK